MDHAQPSREFSEAASQTGSPAMRQPSEDLFRYMTEYAHERPEVIALWAFGIGFILGLRFRLW